MRSIFVIAGAALTLAACGGGTETDEANTLAVDNMLLNDSTMTDPSLNGDMNAMTGANTMDATTENAIEQDLNTNDPDTNLANGL